MTTVTSQLKNYHSSISANVSAKEAFDKICDVPAWWALDFHGNSKKKNDVFSIHFGTTSVTFKIADAVPEEIIVWKVIDSYLPWLNDKEEWTGTKIVFEISSHNGKTKIDVTDVGLTPEVECYESCEQGWNH
ncbi:MAG: SRPBCC domain-containing protein, partial [Bacteroidetes bacterium]|nr:SRPBCC domain-containing protein [Bacteroidota bacterium]